jgi:hypothetical protein
MPQGGDQPGDLLSLETKAFRGVGVSELRELRQLREEVGRLKRLGQEGIDGRIDKKAYNFWNAFCKKDLPWRLN